MEERKTPWEALFACALPTLLLGTALFTGQWQVLGALAIVAVPQCLALIYVLISHEELVNELGATRWRTNEALEPISTPIAPQPPPTQQAERDEVILGVLESVKNHAATKTVPVATPNPATKTAPVMTIPDEPPIRKEAPPKIQAAPSADMDGAKYLPHTGNPPKVKFLHCDQTIPATYPKALRHSGFNVTVTKGSDITEEAQLDMAHEEGRVLVSSNVDYEILAAQGRENAGILIIPRDAKAETFLGACRAIWSKVPRVTKDQGGDL